MKTFLVTKPKITNYFTSKKKRKPFLTRIQIITFSTSKLGDKTKETLLIEFKITNKSWNYALIHLFFITDKSLSLN